MTEYKKPNKAEIKKKVSLKEYSIRKRVITITVAELRGPKGIVIWLFVSQMDPFGDGIEIPTKMAPLNSFVCVK